MKPAWDGIMGWVLIALSLIVLISAWVGSGLDGRHVLGLFLFGSGTVLVAYRRGLNAARDDATW